MGCVKYVVSRGDRFGRLVVIREVRVDGHESRAAECSCDCGGTTTVRLSKLFRGHTASCGCLHRESVAAVGRRIAHKVSHGMVGHPLYDTHLAMMARCYHPQATGYRNYGGRGIGVCTEWHDVRAFIAWVEENLGPRPEGCSLDRADNDSDYEPGKVRWATDVEQAKNRRPRERGVAGRFI